MITRQELEGHWNTVKGRIQEKWGQLTDDDLQQVKGDATQLVGVIQTKTGETRRAIESFLDEAVTSGQGMMNEAVDTARQYADQASQAARRGYEQVSAGLASGMEQTQTMVRRNPMESIGVAFGAGLIAGVITGLVLKSSR
ncbi:MAG: DUF883 family protein [Planctomyces sp.]|nr:DUF883 family protein [Planctomyces sp.]